MKQLDDSDVFDDYNQDNLTHLNRLLTEVRKFVKAFKADKLTTFRAKYRSDSRQNLFKKLEELDQKLESFFKTRHPSPKAVYSDQISVSSTPVDQGSEEPAKIRSFLQKQDKLRLLKQVSNLVDQLNGKTESKDLKQLFNKIKDDFKSIKEVNLNEMVDRYIMLKKYCSDPNHDSDPLSAELERKYYDFIKRQFKDKGENIDSTILEELKTKYPFLNKLNDYNEELISDAKQNLPVLQFTRSILANLVNAASGEHVSSLQEGVEGAPHNMPDYESELSAISTLIEQVSLPQDSFVGTMSLTPSLVRSKLIKRQGSSVQLSEITLEMNEDDPNQQEQVNQLIQQVVQQNKPDLTGFEAQVSTLMTHMFLDADANSSYLEGANQSELMETFNCILKSMVSINCVDQETKRVLAEFAEASQEGIDFEENVKKYGWSENASSIEKALKKMKPKTFMVIPFGWNNTQKTKTGHATYIKLICEADDKFTIQHFNLGGGCNNHQQKKWSDESNQFLYFPFTQISNVSIKKLTSPNFLKHFYDVKCNERIKWTNEDIGIAEVEATLKYLGDFDEPDSYQSELPRYQKTQQSGLCAFHSLRALIIDSLSPKNYAIFNMVSGLKVLHSFEDQCVKQKGMMTPSNLQTLERCILRFIDELKLRKSKLNNAQKVFIQTEVDALLIRVQSRIQTLAFRNVQSFEPGKEILYKAKIGIHPHSSSRTEPLQKVTYSTIDSDFSDVNASSLNHGLASLLNECDKLSNQGQFDHILKLVNRSISTLPSFTPEIYSEPNVMNQLLKLSEFLMQSFSRLNNSKDLSYRHQLDCILSHAKSLILIIKTLQQNYPLPSNYPQNQDEAFGCLIHGLMINESLEKLRSTAHTYGNACVYDSDQQQLFKEIKTELDGIAAPHSEELERTKHKSVALKDYIELKLTDKDDKSPYHPAVTLASFTGNQKGGFNERSLFESGEMHDGYKQFLKALHYYDIATSFEMMKPDSGSFDIEFMRYNNIYVRDTDTRPISNKKMIDKPWSFYTQSVVFPNQIQSRELKTILELKQKTGDRKSDALFLKERSVNDKHSDLMLELENLVSKNHSQSEAQHGVSLGHIISFFKSRLDLLSNKIPAFKGTLDDYANDIGIDSMYNHDLMSSLIIRIKEESFVTDFVARLKKQDNSAKSLKYYNLLTGEKKTEITDKNDFFKDFEAKAKKDRLINTLETVDRSDYREFFKQLLLSESLNESVFESFNALKPELIQFLNSSYDEFKEAKDFEACVFMVKIMVLVESRLGNSIEKSDFNCLGKLTDLENELQKVVSDIDYKKDDLLYLLNELRLVYIGNIKGLQDESLELYIKAAQMTSEANIESPFYDIDIAHICANTRIKFAVPLQGLIKERPDMLKGLPDASDQSFKPVDHTLCFESINYEYDCYKAQLVKKGFEAAIPKKLKHNPMFIALYNEQELSTVENGYSFRLNGMTVNFENTLNGINVKITHEDTTYFYAGNNPFKTYDSTNPLPDYLISNYHLFYKEGGSECMFLNKATNKMEYMGVMDGDSLKDIKDSNGYNLKQLKGSVFECFFQPKSLKILCALNQMIQEKRF